MFQSTPKFEEMRSICHRKWCQNKNALWQKHQEIFHQNWWQNANIK